MVEKKKLPPTCYGSIKSTQLNIIEQLVEQQNGE